MAIKRSTPGVDDRVPEIVNEVALLPAPSSKCDEDWAEDSVFTDPP